MNWLLNRIKGDNVIWGIIMFLSLISVLAIYSSTKSLGYYTKGGNTEYYVLKHLVVMGFGFIVIYFAHNINFKFYSGFSKVLLPVAFLLMLLTYAVGIEVNDAKRWLPVVIHNFFCRGLGHSVIFLLLGSAGYGLRQKGGVTR